MPKVIDIAKHRLNNEPTARLVRHDNEHSVYRTDKGYVLTFYPNCYDAVYATEQAAETAWRKRRAHGTRFAMPEKSAPRCISSGPMEHTRRRKTNEESTVV